MAIESRFANAADGLAAEVYSDNGKSTFRVVFRDTDAGETIAIIRGFVRLADASAKARALVSGVPS